MKINIFLLTTVFALTTSCSTMEKSIVTGASIGAVAGHSHSPKSSRNKSTMKGLLIGSAIGGLIHWANSKKQEKKKVQKSKNKIDPTPLLTRPKIKKIWVKDQIKGNRFIKGHWEYIIKENSRWNR